MRTSVAITIAVCSALYYAVTLVSGLEKRSFIRDDDSLPLTGDDLRILADKVDQYNIFIAHLQNQFPEQFKRGSEKGCAGFSGCAQLAAGQSALQAMIHGNRASLFGSSGPGKRKRSTDEA